MSATENIQTLPELKKALAEVIEQVTHLSTQTEDQKFFAPFGEKWSMAENLEHLILSNGATMKTLSYPIEKLNARFGKPERNSISDVALEKKYSAVVGQGKAKSTPTFNPNQVGETTKEGLLKMWIGIGLGLQKNLQNWSNEDLDNAQIPHPILGNFTIREFLSFTIFHTDRHFQAMKNITELK